MDEQLNLQKKLRVYSVRPTVYKTFTQFCKDTTFHGLQFVGDNAIYLFERMFFAVAFITMCSVAYYFIYVIYERWSEAPVIVSIDPRATYITDIPFPALTICNMNQAMAKAAKNISSKSWESNILETLCNRKDAAEIIKYSKNRTAEISFQDFVLQVSQPCQNMLLACNYGSIDLDCAEIFKPVLTDEGLCCTFNSLDYSFLYLQKPDYLSKKQEQQATPVFWSTEKRYPKNLPKSFFPRKGAGTGVTMGMTIILDAEAHDYFCSSTNGAGFKVVIHSPAEAPLVKEVGINIDVGTETRVRIKPSYETAADRLKHLPKENRKCVLSNEHNLYQFGTYTRRNCEMECEAETVADNCNCALYYMPLIKQRVSTCNINDQKCTNGVTIQLASRSKGLQKCNQICLPSCHGLSFSSTSSSSAIRITDFTIRDQNIQKLNSSYVRNSVSRVDFLYTGNTFNAKPNLPANMGGIISLFLGFSLISLMEVVYFLTLQPLCAELRYFRELRQKYKKFLKNGNQINADLTYLNNDLFSIIRRNINSNISDKVKYAYQD